MNNRKELLAFLGVSFINLLLISLPYFFAFNAGQYGYNFTGFLLNPVDGHSYLAKMYQGRLGDWRFTLPFTHNPGNGGYLFLFYIALGHLGRVTGIENLFIFHIIRLICSGVMLYLLWKFVRILFKEYHLKVFAFAALSLCSGMGWLTIPSGYLPSDFWIAETYPFLSAYTNPHFPFGLALILGVLILFLRGESNWKTITVTMVLSVLLSIVNPFGIIIILMAIFGVFLWQFLTKATWVQTIKFMLTVSAAGLPMILYDLWITHTDSMLRIWNDQNLTPSPPIWDLFLSLSPALLYGAAAVWFLLKDKNERKMPKHILLVSWAILGILSIYLPLNLQRRFMIGLFVPLVGLAAKGLDMFSGSNQRKFFTGAAVFFFLAIPTNLLILLGAWGGIQDHHPLIFMTKDEKEVLDWIAQYTDPEALILASPEMGLFIPAYTGRQVIYGHPFETAYAEAAESKVLNFYSGEYIAEEYSLFIQENQINLVMYGPRERSLGNFEVPGAWVEVYRRGNVRIYKPD